MYFPSDILSNYKRYQLQVAILEYIASNKGVAGHGIEAFAAFAEHIDKTLHWKTEQSDVTKAGMYLLAIKLLKVEDDNLYITEEGIKCLQNYALHATVISMRGSYISYQNWIICTLISLTALAISLLK